MTVDTTTKPPSRHLVFVGLGALAVLIVMTLLGLAIQRTLPEPYPEIHEQSLPIRIARARDVMIDRNQYTTSSRIWWVERRNQRSGSLYYVTVGNDATPTPVHYMNFVTPGDWDSLKFDVVVWPPERDPVLMVMEQRKRNLIVTPVRAGGRPMRPLVAKIPEPAESATRDLIFAPYDGTRPDLFAIDRGLDYRRVQMIILKGDRNLQRQTYVLQLPFRGLGPDSWSVDVADVGHRYTSSTFFSRSSLVLIRHETELEHTIVETMPGSNGFRGFASTRAIDAPGDLGPRNYFGVGQLDSANGLFRIDLSDRQDPRVFVYQLSGTVGVR